MNLSEILAQPKLIPISIDDKDTQKEYGEPVVFYTWDRQPMHIFLQLAATETTNTESVIKICKQLILDQNGNELLKDDSMLPTKILMKAIAKVTEILGK